ncbi:MAG: LysM peptidoglycan-binding domain-containing protein [Akkermansiaceae bacterium]|jgi:LysM repeat protein|nr:LysM peptidoglycan-binding domain-containing protein [Akkermansiaceae bacterium]
MIKTLPQLLIASCLLTSADLGAQETPEELRQRCEEQERQIRRLELENSRLKELVNDRTQPPPSPRLTPETEDTPAEPATPAVAPSTPAPAPAATHTVKAGETLSQIARRYRTTAAALVQLNGLSNAGLIRPGQTLKLPHQAGSTTVVRENTAPATTTKSHQVKAGETFYSIARQHGVSVDDLTRLNPGVNPRTLRVGQRLKVEAAAPATVQTPEESSRVTPAPAPAATVSTSGGSTRATAPAPEASTSSRPVIQHPVVRSIRITERITFEKFAAQYGTTTAKLNALNGLNIDPKQTLAEGSELYVSAQPQE